MKTQGFLDHLLKTAQQGIGQGGLGDLLGNVGGGPLAAPTSQPGTKEDRGLFNADFG